MREAAIEAALCRLGVVDGLLEFVGQPVEMLAEPAEHVAFDRIGGQVPDQGGLSRILSKLFNGSLKILHGSPTPRLVLSGIYFGGCKPGDVIQPVI